jgi:hypothetical protein
MKLIVIPHHSIIETNHTIAPPIFIDTVTSRSISAYR